MLISHFFTGDSQICHGLAWSLNDGTKHSRDYIISVAKHIHLQVLGTTLPLFLLQPHREHYVTSAKHYSQQVSGVGVAKIRC